MLLSNHLTRQHITLKQMLARQLVLLPKKTVAGNIFVAKVSSVLSFLNKKLSFLPFTKD